MFKLNDPHKAILRNFGQDSQLIKGKAAEEGETREWGGKKYRKQAGKWIEITDPKGPRKQEEEGGGKSPVQAGGSPEVSKHDIAQLAHMKSIADSNPEKAYEIYQSLSPEVQEKVPQDVVNKLVSTSHTEKEKEKERQELLDDIEALLEAKLMSLRNLRY